MNRLIDEYFEKNGQKLREQYLAAGFSTDEIERKFAEIREEGQVAFIRIFRSKLRAAERDQVSQAKGKRTRIVREQQEIVDDTGSKRPKGQPR